MSKKLYCLGILSLVFLLSGCGKKDHEKFGPSPGDGSSRFEDTDEQFGPSPGDG
ncbi:hypothetical protein [Simkania sp.]|uniref:hypothetical protein n=1 Tax=Simkania sp. TaxID=34094 RepID=UPI003B52E8EA